MSMLERVCAAVCVLCAWGVVTPGAASAASACATWDIANGVSFSQSNSIGVGLAIVRSGQNIRGTATQYTLSERRSPFHGRDPVQYTGTIDGVVAGNRLDFKVTWDGRAKGKIGVYTVEIDDAGRITGTTYDFHRPSSRAQLIGYERVPCKVATAPPAPAEPPTYRKLGKRTPAAPETPPSPSVLQGQARDNVLASAAPACAQGYVWRAARPDDRVCVTPAARSRVARENADAASRWNPAGAYGPKSCVQGFVWREAYAGDVVCVPPPSRELARSENRSASRLAVN